MYMILKEKTQEKNIKVIVIWLAGIFLGYAFTSVVLTAPRVRPSILKSMKCTQCSKTV